MACGGQLHDGTCAPIQCERRNYIAQFRRVLTHIRARSGKQSLFFACEEDEAECSFRTQASPYYAIVPPPGRQQFRSRHRLRQCQDPMNPDVR